MQRLIGWDKVKRIFPEKAKELKEYFPDTNDLFLLIDNNFVDPYYDKSITEIVKPLWLSLQKEYKDKTNFNLTVIYDEACDHHCLVEFEDLVIKSKGENQVWIKAKVTFPVDVEIIADGIWTLNEIRDKIIEEAKNTLLRTVNANCKSNIPYNISDLKIDFPEGQNV